MNMGLVRKIGVLVALGCCLCATPSALAANYKYTFARYMESLDFICLLRSPGKIGRMLLTAELMTVGQRPKDAMDRRCWKVNVAHLFSPAGVSSWFDVKLNGNGNNKNSLFMIPSTAFRSNIWNATAADTVTVSAANAVPSRPLQLIQPLTLLAPVDSRDPSQSVDVALSGGSGPGALTGDAMNFLLQYWATTPNADKKATADVVASVDYSDPAGPIWTVTYIVHQQNLAYVWFQSTFIDSAAATLRDLGTDVDDDGSVATTTGRRLLGLLESNGKQSRRQLQTTKVDKVSSTGYCYYVKTTRKWVCI